MSGQFPMYPAPYGQEDQEPYAYGMNVPQPQAMNLNGRSQLLPTINPSLLSPQLSNRNSGMNNDLPQYADGGSVGMPYNPMQRPMPMPMGNMPMPMGRMPMQMSHAYGNPMRYAEGGAAKMPNNQSGLAFLAQMFGIPATGLTGDVMNELQNYYGGERVEPQYAKGGHASLRKIASRLRNEGTDGDTILAHINPLEAAQLAAQSGGASINPRTGLPSYKFKLGKVLKTVARVAAPFVGGAIAGPAGAAIGGGLAGALGKGSTKSKITKGLIGAGLGYAGAGGFGNLGGAGTVIPKVNQAVGLTGLASKLGMGMGAAQTAGTLGATNLAGSMAAKNAQQQNTGDNFLSGITASGLAPYVPLAAMGVLATQAKKKYGTEGSLTEIMKREKPEWSAEQQYRKMRPLRRALRSLGAEDYLTPGAPELEYFEEANPEAEPYAHGGLVHYMADGGHLDGYTGGQDDHIDAKLSDGEFVLPADIVSSLGDGNNNAGAKKLDAFMKSVRAHKTSKGAKGLPPKAKSMSAYMQARGAR